MFCVARALDNEENQVSGDLEFLGRHLEREAADIVHYCVQYTLCLARPHMSLHSIFMMILHLNAGIITNEETEDQRA